MLRVIVLLAIAMAFGAGEAAASTARAPVGGYLIAPYMLLIAPIIAAKAASFAIGTGASVWRTGPAAVMGGALALWIAAPLALAGADATPSQTIGFVMIGAAVLFLLGYASDLFALFLFAFDRPAHRILMASAAANGVAAFAVLAAAAAVGIAFADSSDVVALAGRAAGIAITLHGPGALLLDM